MSLNISAFLFSIVCVCAAALAGFHCCHGSRQMIWLLQGIANRDLKLENLLLDRDGHDGTRPLLKICDFGYSKVSSCPAIDWTVL